MWPVDGYAKSDKGTKVYEFMGDYWHKGCPQCDPSGHNPKWLAKKQDIENAGHILQVIWECQFDKVINEIRNVETPLIPDILKKNQTQENLLAGIKSGRLFGFLVCDLDSPPSVIEKMTDFPPIIRSETITDEHLSIYMKQKINNEKPNLKKFERETVIQCFTAKNFLLLSSLAKYYLDEGLIITNIYYFGL